MLNIAICDDEKIITGELDTLLNEIGKELGIRNNIDIFFSGERLCESIACGSGNYDIIFLDIELNEMNGVDVGHFIRNELKNEIIQIVYISSKEDYAMKLFKTRPLDFVIKPIKKEEIKETIKVALQIIHSGKQIFEYSKGQTLLRVPVEEIMYFESSQKKIIIHMAGRDDMFYGKLNEIVERINNPNFIYIHKSYLVNYSYVKRFEYDKAILINDKILSISQCNRKSVRKAQLNLRRGTKSNAS